MKPQLKVIAEADTEAPVKSKVNLAQYEFLAFSVLAFIAKSALLIRLPYRPVWENTCYTLVILTSFYCFLKYRQKLTPPLTVLMMLAAAVAIDVLGNFFHFYGQKFGAFDYDEITHCLGSGFSLAPTMWLLRSTTRKFGHNLPLDMIAFFAVTLTFSFCAYYEILELWDEQYFGGKRLWGSQDTPKDLQFDLIGIIISALISTLVFKSVDRRSAVARA